MPEIEFIGDWSEEQAQAIAASIQKSLGVGEGGGAEVTVQQLADNPIQEMLSHRQRQLLDLWQKAGSATFRRAIAEEPLHKASTIVDSDHECDEYCAHGWSDYANLSKAVFGSMKRDAKGRVYRLNRSNRWERFTGGFSGAAVPSDQFNFWPSNGPFGRGIYFPVVAESGGWMRLRLRLNITPEEVIDDKEFLELEADLAQEVGLVLSAHGVKAIAQSDNGAVNLLMLRSSGDIEVQGAIAGSGELPNTDTYEYHLVHLEPQDDHLIADVEVAPPTTPADEVTLHKSAVRTATRCFTGKLSGSRVVPNGQPALDRQLVRAAVARCRDDGLPLEHIQIRLVEGTPDFLPNTPAFCLPCENTIFLVNHEPTVAIARQIKMLSHQLQTAARNGAIDGDEALEILGKAAELDPQWWIEGLIKRFTGAILCARVADIQADPDPVAWHPYLALLPGRGLEFWGDRQSIAECMAEDYRCAHDPSGLPNSVTMLWDVANPAYARLCQQRLLDILGQTTVLEKQAKASVGDRKRVNGKEYELNRNRRWVRVADDKGQTSSAQREQPQGQPASSQAKTDLATTSSEPEKSEPSSSKSTPSLIDILRENGADEEEIRQAQEKIAGASPQATQPTAAAQPADGIQRSHGYSQKAHELVDGGLDYLNQFRLKQQLSSLDDDIAKWDIFSKLRKQLLSEGLPPEQANELAEQTQFEPIFGARPKLTATIKNTISLFHQFTGGGATTFKRIIADPEYLRAYANEDLINVSGDSGTSLQILFHELGHHIEFSHEDIREAASEFVLSRATGPQKSLNKLEKAKNYEADEEAYPDHFLDHYCGKVYDDGCTELLSMGLERMAEPVSMLEFYEADPDHFAFCVGVLKKLHAQLSTQ